MAASNINRVTVTGNLTRDPELRTTNSGFAICSLRVAVNGRRKDQSGNWIDKPNYFDVTVFGAQGENCNNYLSRGRPVAIDGRLEWSEWEAKDGSGKRQKVEIVADTVQFLGSRDGQGEGGGGGGGFEPRAQRQDTPGDTDFGADPVGAPTGGGGGSSSQEDDDIPF